MMPAETAKAPRSAKIDQAISKRIPLLLVAVFSSLATSWFYKTPELHQKEQQLEVVERKEIPKLKDIAGCQTARARIATRLADDSEHGWNVDLSNIPNCPLPPKLAAEKTKQSPLAASVPK